MLPGGGDEFVGPAEVARIGLSLGQPVDMLIKGSAKYAKELSRIASVRGLHAIIKPPSVILTTFHASKGREAHTVAIHGDMPYRVWRKEAEDLSLPDEERRCLYVALTRAKAVTFINSSVSHMYTDLYAPVMNTSA